MPRCGQEQRPGGATWAVIQRRQAHPCKELLRFASVEHQSVTVFQRTGCSFHARLDAYSRHLTFLRRFQTQMLLYP